MKKEWLLPGLACGVLLISLHAGAKQTTSIEDGYQAATVVSVAKHVSPSNYIGDNPSDAPLQARDYSYDIGIRLNCNLYIGRYESATKYLPSVFAADHEVDVLLRKHIIYVSLPFSDEAVMLGIVRHRRVRGEACGEAAPEASRPAMLGLLSNHPLTRSKFKGGLV
jgi:hypothetical protein